MSQENLILSSDFAIKKSYLTGEMDEESLTLLFTYNAAITYAEKRSITDIKYRKILNRLKNNLAIFTNDCKNLCAVNNRVIYNPDMP